MIDVLVVLAAGALAGYILRKRPRVLALADQASAVSVFALLFLLGFQTGGNGALLGNLRTVGVNAAVIAAAAVAGSVLIISFLSRTFAKRAGREK